MLYNITCVMSQAVDTIYSAQQEINMIINSKTVTSIIERYKEAISEHFPN